MVKKRRAKGYYRIPERSGAFYESGRIAPHHGNKRRMRRDGRIAERPGDFYESGGTAPRMVKTPHGEICSRIFLP